MRRVLKTVIFSIFYLLVLPFGVGARLFRLVFRSSLLFDMFAQAFSLLPGLPGSYLRTCYYQQTLEESHLDVQYSFGAVVTKMKARIGRRVYVGMYTTIGFAEIGEDSVLANYVSILSGRRQHNFDDPGRPVFAGVDTFSKVTIGPNCFFGDKATAMADVGGNTIVGAGAVIVKDIPEYAVAAGVPAKVIKDRRPAAEDPT